MTSYTLGYRNVRGAEKRKDRRLPLPIFEIRLDEGSYETVNWSLGGLLIDGYHGERKEDDQIVVDIQAKDHNLSLRLKITAKIIRVSEDGKLAIQFEEMNPTIYDFFEKCFAARFKKR